MSRTLGAAIAAGGARAGRGLKSRIAGANDVHKAAVEGHYAAEAQQRAHEHTHSMIDKVHGYSGGGEVRLRVGADGSHEIGYSKGGAAAAAKKPAARTASKSTTTSGTRKPRTSASADTVLQHRDKNGKVTGHTETVSREKHTADLAADKKPNRINKAIKDSTAAPAKAPAKPAVKKPAAKKPTPTGNMTDKKFGTDR